jgi:signal transduction histidine kinase
VNENNKTRSFFRSDRPPVELPDINRIYRRNRVGVSLGIIVSGALLRGQFENPSLVVGGIVLLSSLILVHALVRKRAELLEMVVLDTSLYLGMAILIDMPEVALFVALAQSFIAFFFLPARSAVASLTMLTLGGFGAAAITLVWQLQSRTATQSVLIIGVVTVLTLVPLSWVLLCAGAEMHRHRDKEEKLAREKDDLLVDKDRFVASVSHELRTPLTTVVGLAHTLTEDSASLTDEERTEFLETLVEQSEEVAAIVEDLLVAARAETGHLSLVLEEVDLAEQLSAVIEPGIKVINSAPPQLLVTADPIRVRQVLRNLISNSHRYGGPNRRVRLSTQGINGIVSIEDDGSPIDPDRSDLIFAAYGRAHDRPGRTDSVGLGLTVSRQLARLMGGDVIYDHHDGWTSFSLVLPTAFATTTRAIYDEPEAAARAHRVGVG